MRSLKIIFLVIFALFCTTCVYAQDKPKGASETAQEKASDQAIFNRVTDWFATVGKSSEEKDRILTERKAKRLQQKAERGAQKAARQAERVREETQQGAREGMQGAQEKMQRGIERAQGRQEK